MKVFISWSGIRSKTFAELFHDFLERVLHPIKPWMSSLDIEKGIKWSDEIGNRLSEYQFGIICVTPENQNSSWLMFEAGAISKTIGSSRVFPVLIGMDYKDLISPLNQYQATLVQKEDILKLLVALNDQLGEFKMKDNILQEEFLNKWRIFEEKLNNRLSNIQFQSTTDIFPHILTALRKTCLPFPEIGNTVQFKEGFESHLVYEAAFKSARKRLYIFGRKNRKVFDKEHWWFFEQLKKSPKDKIDFKCLFLDPNSPEDIILSAHQDNDFSNQLNNCVNNAISVFNKFALDKNQHIRFYKNHRAFSLIIVDDAILFKPIEYGETGRAKRLTKSSFTLTNSKTNLGIVLEENFLSTWNMAK